MRIFLILLVMFFIKGCTQNVQNSPYNSERTPDGIMHQVAMQLKREKNLIPCGSGGGNGEMNKVRMLYLAFNYYKEMDIEEARTLLIEASNIFLKTINEDAGIQSHLVNYPFQPKNIEMTICFFKPNKKDVNFEKLNIISLRSGKIKYKINNPITKFLETILIETYEEAEEKVNKTKVI